MGVVVLYWIMQLDAARLPEAQVLSLLDLDLLIAYALFDYLVQLSFSYKLNLMERIPCNI